MSARKTPLENGMLVQGDGSGQAGIAGLAPQQMYEVKDGQLVPIRDAFAFHAAGHRASEVRVVPDAELAHLPRQLRPALDAGQEIALDLDSFLGAGHYMDTHGVMRRTPDGAHIDATTRTRTVTWFGGYHGGVNLVYRDAEGQPVGMSSTKRFGVDGTWIGRSDRTDYWSEELTADQAARTTGYTIFHFWAPDQLEDVVRRGVTLLTPVVQIIADVIKLGGKSSSS